MKDLSFKWDKLNPQADPSHSAGKPCSRSSHGVSWIDKSSKLIVYGGEAIARTPIEHDQAAWSFDAKKNQWNFIKSNPPPLRVAHAQAYHDASSSVYIFGGRAGILMQEQAMNDLWKLDCSFESGEEIWSEVSPNYADDCDPAPEPRSFHKMVCIGDDLYVFGGCGSNGRMADMHKFNLITRTWHNLGNSSLIKGRGGATILKLNNEKEIGIVAGFDGDESNDGHKFNVSKNDWCDYSMVPILQSLRPRSVAIGASFPKFGICIIFGGEVDPSDKGHEGAGGFENDLVILDEETGECLKTIRVEGDNPGVRGWSDGAVAEDKLFIFGGLAGDDENPKRLDDMWILTVKDSI